jgi:hypothetical protein
MMRMVGVTRVSMLMMVRVEAALHVPVTRVPRLMMVEVRAALHVLVRQ